MKKGFFLLEALLASAVLMIIVGGVIHHYGQWARAYRSTKQCNTILSHLHEYIEKDDNTTGESYRISKRVHTIDRPIGLPTGIIHPRVQCKEVEIACIEDERKICVIAGVIDEE